MSRTSSPPATQSRRCGLALGSNLGDRVRRLEWTIGRLECRFGPVTRSPFYETAPVGCPAGSGTYVNAVVEIATDIAPPQLLDYCHALEAEAGRVRTGVYGEARPLDIDILYMGDLQWNTPTLTVPHPRAHERRFVLRPLADIRPDLALPGQRERVREILARLRSGEPEPVLLPSFLPPP